MASGGHNRKSRAQAEREGTARADRHVEPVVVAPGEPDKPEHLTAKAAKLWDQFVPMLAESGVIEKVDPLGLAQMFEAYSMAAAAREQIGDYPIREVTKYDSKSGEPYIVEEKHPGIGAWKDAVSILRGLLADYAMQPLARTRLGDALRPPGEHGPQ